MPTLLFLSEGCLLDRKSGAAQSALALLYAAVDAGWQVHAATATLCDGEAEYPLADIEPLLNPAERAGTVVSIADDRLEQLLYVTASTRHQALTRSEHEAYCALAAEQVANLQPDMVLTMSSQALQPVLQQARRQGARTVFYLANPAYAEREGFRFRGIDHFLVPSQALADLYRAKMGIDAHVVHNMVTRWFEGSRNLEQSRIAGRGKRFVTMINPDPAKGGLFFLNLVNWAREVLPEVRFRVVESRWGRDAWRRRVAGLDAMDNLEWIPHCEDMSSVFAEASLLLVPSLWFEAAGRVVAEALLAGVPVLAMNRGALEEQLNGGGFVFEAPKAMVQDYLAPPDVESLHAWSEYIRVLMEDDSLYRRAVLQALAASARYVPELTRSRAVTLLKELLAVQPDQQHSDDARVQAALAAFRGRMKSALEAGNRKATRLSESDDPDYSPSTAYAEAFSLSLAQPVIQEARSAIKAGDLEHAGELLEAYLVQVPEDLLALLLMAGVAEGYGAELDARQLLQRVAFLAPGYVMPMTGQGAEFASGLAAGQLSGH